jgi:putative membrane protein
MKKIQLAFAAFTLAVGFTACNGNDTDSTSSTTTTSTTDTSTTNANNSTNNNNTSATTTTANAKMPLNAADSAFVMKAAAGGMMEVEAGNIAQQNAQSDRVKAFGSMMVKDHSAANQELMSLASSRGITLPTDLPASMKKHMDQMRNMKGKQFDNHYMSMMLSDHKKDVSEFEKNSNSANDAELKAWATKTLPVLRTHLDSAQAISKAKM